MCCLININLLKIIMSKIKAFAKCIIESYNFSTHTKTGFSCYIPDSNQGDDDGFIIWVYSETHTRFETHFQNLFSSNRMNVINHQFNKVQSEYVNEMYDSVTRFISELDHIPGFHRIGNGINNGPSNSRKIYNRAISFDFIENDSRILKNLETVLTNNSLIYYICILKQDRNIPLKSISTSC